MNKSLFLEKSKKPILCIMGATATGKTALALELARQLPCEIISVDSAMVYRGMDIGTAKPDAATLESVPHHLINILEPTASYSAATFRADALRLIEQILARNHLPVLVGGTMLYFQTLLRGISALPSADPAIRAQLTQEIEHHGLNTLYQRLQQVDPVAAARINSHDTQRIQRALEVYLLTGRPMSEWWFEPQSPSTDALENLLPVKPLLFALMPADRANLHLIIEQRFDQMLAAGLIDEVRCLVTRGDVDLTKPAMKTVGYRQVWHYLQGEINYEQMREKAIAATRQLAKRQLTWLRHWPGLVQLTAGDSTSLCQQIMASLQSI